MTKIKAFFKKWVFKNLRYKIFAVVLAFVLWLIILNVTDPDATKTINNIYVTIENEDAVLDGTRIYEIVSGETTSISVTGARSIISSLSADDFIASVDFEELSTANSAIINVELTGDMSKYSNKVEIVVKTTSMVIDIDDITTLVFPVEIIFTGDADEDMILESAYATPESVNVTAPQSVLDTIASAVAYVNYSEIESDASVRSQLYLLDSDGNEVNLGNYGSTDCTSVLSEIDVSYTKTVVIYMADPEDTTADGYVFEDLTYSVVSVTIKGDPDLISSVNSIEIPNTLIDLTDAEANVSVTVSVSDYLPDGVSLYGDSGKVVITAVVSEDEEATADEETTEDEEATEDEEETTASQTTEEEQTTTEQITTEETGQTTTEQITSDNTLETESESGSAEEESE